MKQEAQSLSAQEAAVNENIANEQLRMVLSHAMFGTIGSTLFAIAMAAHFAGLYDRNRVWFWAAAKVLVVLPRIAQAQHFRRHPLIGGPRWRLATYSLLGLDALVWAAAGFWLMRLDLGTTSLAIASLGGIVCAATFGLQVSVLAVAAYVTPIMAAMIAGLLLRGDSFGIYCAVGLTLFLAQALLSGKRSARNLAETFRLRITAIRISAERAEALELVERQSAVKSQFLGTVSHELRTPIHGMLGLARLVHVESDDMLVKKRMELVEATGTHLLGLVTDLIDVSRVGSGQMKIQKVVFDLFAEVERMGAIYAVRASEKGLAFTLDNQLPQSTFVAGDPARTRQILHNLLGNAIKFTQKGWVHMLVRAGDPDGKIQFEIRDTGVGVSEEDQKTIFEAFSQVGARMDGRPQGTGLGLTIASEIAKLLGGGINVKSTPGFGSIFEFTAQFEPAVRTVSQFGELDDSSSPNNKTTTPARILLVEDNDVNALIASSILANFGHYVERAHNGIEAVGRALREIDRPDLVLMDCMMPLMNGYDASRSIRTQERALGLSRVPIIALSATVDEEVGKLSLAAGMDDALGKPFTGDELLEMIDAWLPPAPPKLGKSRETRTLN